jgi:hypothetical protein
VKAPTHQLGSRYGADTGVIVVQVDPAHRPLIEPRIRKLAALDELALKRTGKPLDLNLDVLLAGVGCEGDPAAIGAVGRESLTVRAFPDTRTLELSTGGDPLRLDMQGNRWGTKWNVLYRPLRLLLLQLRQDLDDGKPDAEVGWVRASDLDPRSRRVAQGALRVAMSRLRRFLTREWHPFLRVAARRSHSEADGQGTAPTQYRLEGDVLTGHLQLYLDLPDPNADL